MKFIPAILGYQVTTHGQLMHVPDVAHIGFRNTVQQQDIVHIWPLRYQIFTDEMLGAMTPPEERTSQWQGKNPPNYNTTWQSHSTD